MTPMQAITRIFHLSLVLVGGGIMFPYFVLSQYEQAIPLIIINSIIVSISLYYYFKIIMHDTEFKYNDLSDDNTNNEELEKVKGRTISSRKCPCGHIPIEHDLVHCTFCNGCVEELDHHCIYLGCCIYKNNIIDFYKFISSVAILCIFGFIFSGTLLRNFYNKEVTIANINADEILSYPFEEYDIWGIIKLLVIFKFAISSNYINNQHAFDKLTIYLLLSMLSAVIGILMSFFTMFHLCLYFSESSTYLFWTRDIFSFFRRRMPLPKNKIN